MLISPFAVAATPLRGLTFSAEDETGADTSTDTSTDTGTSTTDAATYDFTGLPETYKDGDNWDFARLGADFTDAQAQLAALGEGVPQNADGYEFTVPEEMDYGEIEVPDWFEFTLDAENPILGELRAQMHEWRLPAEASGAMLGFVARYEALKAQNFQAQADQEMASLGPQHQARLQSVQRSIETRVKNADQAKALVASLTTADAVRALEGLLRGAAPSATPGVAPRAAFTEDMRPLDRLKAANAAKAS